MCAEKKYTILDYRNRGILLTIEKKIDMMQNHRLLQDIMDYSPTLIVTVDPEDHFISVNAKFASIFKKKPCDFTGKDRKYYLSPDIARQHHDNDLLVIEAGDTLTFEEQIEERDGIHCYSTVKFPMRDENGKIYGITGISNGYHREKKDRKRTVA